MDDQEIEQAYEEARQRWDDSDQDGMLSRFFFFAGAEFGVSASKKRFHAERTAKEKAQKEIEDAERERLYQEKCLRLQKMWGLLPLGVHAEIQEDAIALKFEGGPFPRGMCVFDFRFQQAIEE